MTRHSLEKSREAVRSLSVGTGSIRDRVFRAMRRMSTLDSEDPNHFPTEETASLFRNIESRLATPDPIGAEGMWQASLNAMSNDEAAEIADMIVRLKHLLEEHFQRR